MSKLIISISLVLFLSIGLSAQLKIGAGPSSVKKSAILELESDKQGLLLPRLSDTFAINGLNPPDGMLVYYEPSKTVLFRSNGKWRTIPALFALGTNPRSPINDINLFLHGDTFLLNIPDANDSVRGVVTTNIQNFKGYKNFLNGICQLNNGKV